MLVSHHLPLPHLGHSEALVIFCDYYLKKILVLREGFKKIWNFGMTHWPFFWLHIKLSVLINDQKCRELIWIPCIFLLLNPILVIHSPEDYVTCCGHHCACCGQNFACSGRYCARRGKIWLLRRQKFACLKVVLSFFEKFSKFFWIFNGKNTLFTKSSQKMV